MKTPFYLVVDKKGKVRACKTQPNLNWDEISIKMDLELPDSLFKKPLLSGNIVVKESDVTPTLITPEIKNNIQAAIKEHSGIEIKLNIINEDKK